MKIRAIIFIAITLLSVVSRTRVHTFTQDDDSYIMDHEENKNVKLKTISLEEIEKEDDSEQLYEINFSFEEGSKVKSLLISNRVNGETRDLYVLIESSWFIKINTSNEELIKKVDEVKTPLNKSDVEVFLELEIPVQCKGNRYNKLPTSDTRENLGKRSNTDIIRDIACTALAKTGKVLKGAIKLTYLPFSELKKIAVDKNNEKNKQKKPNVRKR